MDAKQANAAKVQFGSQLTRDTVFLNANCGGEFRLFCFGVRVIAL